LITIRPLLSHEDLLACVSLQREVWGADFQECVAPTLLKVSQKIGGIAAGAFDESGDGIAKLLKEHQRRVCRALQVETIFWTFDPLAARNAYLNLNRLGAKVVEYVPDMYPPTGSPLHGSVATDRFIVSWDTSGKDGDKPRFEAPAAAFESIPVLDGNDGGEVGKAADLNGSDRPPLVRTAIPADFEALLEADVPAAERWRQAVRHGLMKAMQEGYSIISVLPPRDSGNFHYVLADTRAENEDGHKAEA